MKIYTSQRYNAAMEPPPPSLYRPYIYCRTLHCIIQYTYYIVHCTTFPLCPSKTKLIKRLPVVPSMNCASGVKEMLPTNVKSYKMIRNKLRQKETILYEHCA